MSKHRCFRQKHDSVGSPDAIQSSVTCPPGVVHSKLKHITGGKIMSLTLSGQVTVYFENPFWVGVFERREGSHLSVCRVVFGPEPKDYEVYAFIEANYYKLDFSSPIKIDKTVNKRINPKRLQRQIKKAVTEKGIETKAQEAIRLERESRKLERKQKSKDYREAQKKELFQKKQEKKKQKRKGH